MIPAIKNKQDLQRALTGNELRLLSDVEVVNDTGSKSLSDKLRSLLRQQKKLHVVILERQ